MDQDAKPAKLGAIDTQVAPDGPGASGSASVGRRLARGEVVGRYVILSTLGVGGMGIVHAAYDPQLDRKVALKLVLPDAARGSHARLQREAQALAKLGHPNVVTIHDVGSFDERVWIAMEFIEGRTLRAWAREQPRTWQEVCAVMLDAGRGLAAAHLAGLLHRDFKPDNVMVGRDGRVRVMDFGLARSDHAKDETCAGSPAEFEQSATSSSSALGLHLTRTGALLGTPAYMAPELLSGVAATAASDQFSFCVALWEQLYGERPFVGESLVELALEISKGRPRTPPRGTATPRWIRRICERGMAEDPNHRWPSLDVLLRELERVQARARARRVLVLVGGLALVAGGLGGYRTLEHRQRVQACAAEGDTIAEVWNADLAELTRARLQQTDASDAVVIAERVTTLLDDYARQWRSTRTSVCTDAEVHDRLSPALARRARHCLDTRRLELGAVIDALSRPERRSIQDMIRGANALPQSSLCVDPLVLDALPELPRDKLEALGTVRTLLARAWAASLTKDADASMATAKAALEEAERLGWTPMIAEARVLYGYALAYAGVLLPSEEALARAYAEAVEARAWAVASEAAVAMIFVVGVEQRRFGEGTLWFQNAELTGTLAGDPGASLEIRRLNNIGALYNVRGDLERAQQMHRQAVELAATALGPGHLEIGINAINLASIAIDLGELDEAEDSLERALAVSERALGQDHADLATVHMLYGDLHTTRGEFDAADRSYRRALTIREHVLGPHHPLVAPLLNNFSLLARDQGEFAEAEARLLRALKILRAHDGPNRIELANVLFNLGELAVMRSDFEAGVRYHAEATRLRREVFDPEHEAVGKGLERLGRARFLAGRHAEATTDYRVAVAIYQHAIGPDALVVGELTLDMAEIMHADGREAEAETAARRAVELGELHRDAPLLGRAYWLLAQITWPRTPDEARALAERALTSLEDGAELRTEIERWLAEHERQVAR